MSSGGWRGIVLGVSGWVLVMYSWGGWPLSARG